MDLDVQKSEAKADALEMKKEASRAQSPGPWIQKAAASPGQEARTGAGRSLDEENCSEGGPLHLSAVRVVQLQTATSDCVDCIRFLKCNL